MTPNPKEFFILGAKLLDPNASKALQYKNIWIKDGKVKAIENPNGFVPKKGAATIDAKGLWIMPGLIDAHVHLREPGQEHKETMSSGTLAAVAGGFTSVACMANTNPTNDSPFVTKYIQMRAKESAYCRVFPIGAVTKGLKGQELAMLTEMVEAGAVAFSDDGMPVMNSLLMRRAMEIAKSLGVPIISHAEDAHLVDHAPMNEGSHSLRLGLRGNPNAAEEIMIAREIALCRLTRCKTHIAHLSTSEGVTLVRRAKEEGLPITAEVSPHHLTLTDQSVGHYDTHCKMAPPLRQAKDIDSLVEGLKDGTIDLLATDHAPHAEGEKNLDFESAAYGVTGLQTAVPLTYGLVLQKKLSLKRWIEAWTSAPASLLGQKHLGKLRKAGPADFTLFNPNQVWQLDPENNYSNSKNSPFFGKPMTGKIVATFVEGQFCWSDGLKVTGQK